MNGVIVTGTDTGVGKTFVSALLCQAMAPVTYVKPVQTGLATEPADAVTVARMADVPTRQGRGFHEALAPAVAARRSNETVTRQDLLQPFEGLDKVVAEGAGGILVELGTDGTTIADLALALDLPMVVVARPGLGTLNHTRLTCEAARTRGVQLAGIIVCGYPQVPGVLDRSNLDGLAAMAPLLGVVPEWRAGTPLPNLHDAAVSITALRR